MADLNKIFDNVKVAIVVSDPDCNVTYANERCKEIFKALLNQEDFVGKNMKECHKPETMVKRSALYDEFREKKKSLSYYTMDVPDGKATIVDIPIYEGDEFTGCVEFVFEGSLA